MCYCAVEVSDLSRYFATPCGGRLLCNVVANKEAEEGLEEFASKQPLWVVLVNFFLGFDPNRLFRRFCALQQRGKLRAVLGQFLQILNQTLAALPGKEIATLLDA